MRFLEEVISGMTKEEIQAYKLYTLRKNAEKERKDLILFDAIRKKGDKYIEDEIADLLYGNKGKNSFYRLKNRLTINILKSLSVHYYDDKNSSQVYHFLHLSEVFSKKRLFKVAHHLLKKAEEKSQEAELYELLEVIYSRQIGLSQEVVTVDPEEYIAKREQNGKKLEKLRALENTLAVLSYKLKTTQNYTSKKTDLIPFLEKTVSDLVEDKSTLTPKFKLKVYRAVSQILLSKREYVALEDYLIKTYQQFIEEKLFNDSNHDFKLQILTYIVNTLFKNHKIKDSLNWANELKLAMDEFKGKLKGKYEIYYLNALVNNYNVIDKEKSISILEDVRDSDLMKRDPYFGIFVHVNLALNWFDKFDYKRSLRNFTALQLLDQYEKTSASLKFKWSIGELIVRFKIGNSENFKNKLKMIKEEFVDEIKDLSNVRDVQFIKILELLEKDKLDDILRGEIRLFMSNKGNDDELIDYNSWLRTEVGKTI